MNLTVDQDRGSDSNSHWLWFFLWSRLGVLLLRYHIRSGLPYIMILSGVNVN